MHKCSMSLISILLFCQDTLNLCCMFENRQQIQKVFLRLYLPENTTPNTAFNRVSESLLILGLRFNGSEKDTFPVHFHCVHGRHRAANHPILARS